MRLKSIFQKIVIPMVLIVCFLGTAILGIVGMLFRETYERQIYEENNDTASFVAQSTGSFMEMAYRITEQLAVMGDVLSMSTSAQTPVLVDTAERNDYFELIYIQDMEGDQTGRSTGELGNRANRWWFIEMQERWEPFVSQSYYSVNTNMACASIFIPLEQDGRRLGILATDIRLDKIQEAVAEFSNVEEGRISFIIDGEGVVVAHPEAVYYEELYNYKNMTRTVTVKDASGDVCYDDDGNIVTEELPIEISAEYAGLIGDVMAGNSGQGLISDNGREYYVSYAPIPMMGSSDSWSVITLRERRKALALMDQIIWAGAAATVVAVVLAIVLILILSRSITRPVKICLERLRALSQGDLSTEVPAVRGRDESVQLLAALSDMIQTLRTIMDDISGQLDRIAHGDLTDREEHTYCGEFDVLGKSLNRIGRSLNQSFRQVGIQSQRVSRNADVMSGMAQSFARDTAVQASAVEELSASIHGTAERSRESAQTALLAKEKMAQVDSDMDCSNESINELLAAMNLIYEDSRKIGGISKTIQDISFQTNLLSMNASVEAARAGEAGKGFSVIASEIRELSQHCSEAATSTEELIEGTLRQLETGMTALKKAVLAIEGSTSGAAEVGSFIQEISEAAEEQMESMKQISLALEQISSVVQNNSQMAKESASLGEEMKENAYSLQETVQRYQCWQ